MHRHHWTLVLGAAALYALQCAASNAAEPKIGNATAPKTEWKACSTAKSGCLCRARRFFRTNSFAPVPMAWLICCSSITPV